jgi:hypothetical protein|uniref:CHCH domain-containing protein n=1 Tax=viral metagenome TaxID=1070528 RepID=A0A6C0EGD2_9ZZZZ
MCEYKNFKKKFKTFQIKQKQIDKCKTLNNQLWKCIEKNKYIYNCGSEYYYFIKCIDKIK